MSHYEWSKKFQILFYLVKFSSFRADSVTQYRSSTHLFLPNYWFITKSSLNNLLLNVYHTHCSTSWRNLKLLQRRIVWQMTALERIFIRMNFILFLWPSMIVWKQKFPLPVYVTQLTCYVHALETVSTTCNLIMFNIVLVLWNNCI